MNDTTVQPDANEDVISKTVAAQREFFLSGKTRPYAFRRAMLEKLQDAIKNSEAALAQAMMSDLHKHPMEGYMCETGLVLDEIGTHIKHLARWMKEKRVPTPLAQFYSKSFLSPEPYGVALIMAPWNYPVQLCLEPLIGAVSAGNCAVLKPSAYAPAVSELIAKIIADNFPAEYIAVIQGGREQNKALLAQRFDYIFFTGSVTVGKVVMQAAARDLTPLTLELGGKSPVIVDSSANLKLAARRIMFGKVINAGQTCVAPDYVLVQSSVRDELVNEMRTALGEFFPNGDYSDMARIISQKHYTQKKALLENQNAVIGGGCDDGTRFVQPTVLIDVDENSPVMQEEIFGPILPVLTWETLDEAIDFVRSREKPLALYLFTSDKAVSRRVLDSCSFGGGCINDTVIHTAVPKLGFGGVGYSGMGRYHGKLSFDTFSHTRGIIDKSAKIDLPIRYFPYNDKKAAQIKMFLK